MKSLYSLIAFAIWIVTFMSCHDYAEPSMTAITLKGDTIPLLLSVDIDDDEFRYYKKDSLLLQIKSKKESTLFAATQDTISYLIKKDSIIILNTDEFYTVKDNLIVSGPSRISGKRIVYFYDKDTRLVKSGNIDECGDMGSCRYYIWKDEELQSVTAISGNIRINEELFYSHDRRKNYYGGLAYYIYHLLGEYDIPFILLGYYGKIPNSDLIEIKHKTSESSTNIKNIYDEDGFLCGFYRDFQNLKLKLTLKNYEFLK